MSASPHHSPPEGRRRARAGALLPWFRRADLRSHSERRIQLGFLAAVASLIGVAVITLRNTETIAGDTAWVGRRLAVTHDLTSLSALLSDADSSLRRYLASADPAEVRLLGRLTDSLRPVRADLRMLMTETGEPRAAADSLDAAITRQLAKYPAATQRTPPSRPGSPTRAITELPFPDEFPEIRRLSRKVFTAEREALSARIDGLRAGTSAARVTAWAGTGFALFMLVGASRLIRIELAERRRAEGRFRAVVESAPGGVVMVDREGRIVLVNRELERLFGHSREEMVGQRIELLLPNAMAHAHATLRQAYLETPTARAMGAGRDLFGQRKDGSQVPVEIGLNPIETREGAFILASVVDITARRRAEETQTRLAEIIKSSDDAIISKDLSGTITSWNPGAEALFGYSADEAIGQSITMLFPPELLEQEATIMAGLRRGEGVRHYEAARRRKDGSTIDVSITISPIADRFGRIIGASKIARDISAQKQAEARFRTVVESAPSGMVMIDRNGRIALVNREIERLFGYDREELLGQRIERLVPERFRQAHPKHRDEFFHQPQTRSMGAGRDLFGIRKDGAEIPVEIGLNPIETPEGLFVLASVVDISARKQAELELLRSNEELERFAYVASHDLQEPLRMVASYVQLLSRRYKGRLDSDADEFIGFALDGAVRMQRLIQDLLAFSRVGRMGAPLAPVNPNEVLDGVLRNLQLAITESGTVVMYDLLPTVRADRGQLEHLLQNLISNAIKFRGPKPPAIQVTAVRQHGDWQFTVRDNGIGIEPQYFERIFVLFQRLHSREEYTGTGIGLAIAKKIVERHGGRIWVESAPGAGSAFHFTMPAERGAES